MVQRLNRFPSCCSALAVLLLLSSARAETPPQAEYRVKAAFLYTFAKFVTWPQHSGADTSDTMHICVLGKDPFGDAFETVFARTTTPRRVEVTRHRSASGTTACDVVFISASERERLPRILRHFGNRAVLTVSDMEGFADSGGMINFVIRNNRVGFRINLDAAERSGLKLSSKLLRLADVIREERGRMSHEQ